MQVSVLAHRGLRIGNKEIECLIQNLLLSASLKNAENSKFLNKDISIAFLSTMSTTCKSFLWRPAAPSKNISC